MMSEMKTFFDYQSDLYACDYAFIKISGTLKFINFESRDPYFTKCLRKIKQWGTVELNTV